MHDGKFFLKKKSQKEKKSECLHLYIFEFKMFLEKENVFVKEIYRELKVPQQ